MTSPQLPEMGSRLGRSGSRLGTKEGDTDATTAMDKGTFGILSWSRSAVVTTVSAGGPRREALVTGAVSDTGAKGLGPMRVFSGRSRMVPTAGTHRSVR